MPETSSTVARDQGPGGVDPQGRGSRVVRWSLWLLGGTVAGLLIGFWVGLNRPRPRSSTAGSW